MPTPYKRPEERAAIDRFIKWCHENGAPMGVIYYWTTFYLKGEDMNGAREEVE